MLHTTFRKVHDAGACVDRYKIFGRKMGGITTYGRDTPIPLVRVLDDMGLADTLWALGATIEPAKNLLIEFACRCAEHVLANFEALYPTDKRPRQAIEAARLYLIGESTAAESAAKSAAWSAESAARSAAWSAESAARSAESAARSAAWSAGSAAWSAESAAKSAAWSAESAAWSAESAAWSARSAGSAAWSARSAARKWQVTQLRQLLEDRDGNR